MMPQQATAKLNITIKSICCAKVKGVDDFLEKDVKPETNKEETPKVRTRDSDSSD
jgi:hypothetical protein